MWSMITRKQKLGLIWDIFVLDILQGMSMHLHKHTLRATLMGLGAFKVTLP